MSNNYRKRSLKHRVREHSNSQEYQMCRWEHRKAESERCKKWDLNYRWVFRVRIWQHASLSVETKFWKSQESCGSDRDDFHDLELARICLQISCHGTLQKVSSIGADQSSSRFGNIDHWVSWMARDSLRPKEQLQPCAIWVTGSGNYVIKSSTSSPYSCAACVNR